MNTQSQETILELAINRAIENGWSSPAKTFRIFFLRIARKYLIEWTEDERCIRSDYENDIIFNRDFAKALWGEDRYSKIMDGQMATINFRERVKYAPAWKVHLQQMVIADDHIKYLGENLKPT